ncbi:hypothetical protein L0Z72_07900 [candidate division KSB1 bacterium]|nr:hypothetical protein [candidate division KSB1 bacterium]
MEFEKLISNPWDNVYWFSRMLINSDKYGGIGADSKTMLNLAHSLQTLLHSDEFKNETELLQFDALTHELRNVLLCNKNKGTAKYRAVEALCNDLIERMDSPRDFEVLALTCKKIMVPINNALKEIPSDDNAFVESVAKTLLDKKGVKGLSNIINILDDVGSKGCMSAERREIIQALGILRKQLKTILTDDEMDIVLSAFCQEFERRVGQKRKGRAGRGVEGTTSIILNYFGIKATHAPEHFTTGLEIDKWIKTKDGWLIGISCKRTLRERWKQAYTTDMDLLNRHKIRELWHVLTYDKDLSDDKVTEIGSHRAILYLPDNSLKLKNALQHPGMKNYVRPMTHFIDDLKKLI